MIEMLYLALIALQDIHERLKDEKYLINKLM